MSNLFMENLKENTNYKETENGGIAHKSTNSAIYDMFAFGGAYRNRPKTDTILLFKNAYEENKNMALKCLFYLRDILEGQGERKFFRICFSWLCNEYPQDAEKLLNYISEYGRWDDLIYSTLNTKLQTKMLSLIYKQFLIDLDCQTPSLLAKWLPSENASAYKTKKTATTIRKYFNMTHKEYRQALTTLRNRINIVETLMSQNRWDEIEFDKIPSIAGLKYKNAFARRDLIAKKYKEFIKSDETKVNTKALYPYNIIRTITKNLDYWNKSKIEEVERKTLEKYWNNLPNYLEGGKNQSIMCVVDTSGSMTWASASEVQPIDVAISLGMYAAERCSGPFKNHYISFSSRPQLIKIEGVDFVDKVERIYNTNLCDNTNLKGVFDLLKETALADFESIKDMPSTLIIISDMEIDEGSHGYYHNSRDFQGWTTESAATEMEKIRTEWAAAGLTLPNLVYWNVNARNNTILDSGDSVTFVSGCSPTIFQQVCKGVKGVELMNEILLGKRYEKITL